MNSSTLFAKLQAFCQAGLKNLLCLGFMLFTDFAISQVSNIDSLLPLEGVVIPKVQSNQQPVKPLAVFKDCDDCPEMVVIPAGSFLMGSPPDPEQDPFSNTKPVKIARDNEKPQHRVNIQSFAIGKYEVTQGQWYAVMGSNPSLNKGRSFPVDGISWDDSQLFVQKLSQKTGKKYRLPSEAEWEYSARHVSAKKGASANITNPVDPKKSNQFGLHDMRGKVLEWTEDCWNENYNGAPIDGSAWLKGQCNRRVFRGGSWYSEYRDWYNPATRYDGSGLYGLRVVRDL